MDAPTCKNIVLARVVGSMTEFKQIIGRGTRVRDDYGKLWFNIIDYTGSATRLFADPAFDGDPVRLTEEEIDETGRSRRSRDDRARRRRGRGRDRSRDHRAAAGRAAQVLLRRRPGRDRGPPGLRARPGRQAAPRGPVHRLRGGEGPHPLPDRAGAARPLGRPGAASEIIESWRSAASISSELAEAAGQPDADPFDLLCHLAFNAPLRTRRERAQRLRETSKDFFDRYGPEARQILEELLEKYAEHGDAQFVLPDVLKVPPLSTHGTVSEIIELFGGPEHSATP